MTKKRFRIDSYTAPKAGNDPHLNEDIMRYADDIIVLSDGATSKSPEIADQVKHLFDIPGGRFAAEIAVSEAMTTKADGIELIDAICRRIEEVCENNAQEIPGIGQVLVATIAAARIDYDADELVITRVGDTGVRVVFKNGTTCMLVERKGIDVVDASKRARTIHEALASGVEYSDAIKQGRKAILGSMVNATLLHRNNPSSQNGFGCLAAGGVPDKFIKVDRFALRDVATVELLSDGYLYASPEEFPKESSVRAWEEHIQRVHVADPDKYLRYLATKPSDDRTIVIGDIE